MDVEDARRILFTRVQGFDTENAFKIMGFLLLQDWGEQDLLRLALGSDVMLHSLVTKAKKELGFYTRTPQLSGQSFRQSQPYTNINTQPMIQVSPLGLQTASSERSFTTVQTIPSLRKLHSYPSLLVPSVNHQWSGCKMDPMQANPSISCGYEERGNSSSGGSIDMPEQGSFFTIVNQKNSLQMPIKRSLSSLGDTRSCHLSTSLAWKPCAFFNQGYCKHGTNCHFLHHEEMGFPVPDTEDYLSTTEPDDDSLTPESLECLVWELRELLQGFRTPVSVASLPQLYYEKFGKILQPEIYSTEIRCDGRARYSLTKLLMILQGTVTLIEWPHGQHAVVLTEDAHKFTDLRSKRDDSDSANPGSRQIYLTFPADSNFAEEDVTIHFRAYGPVQDVRIPYQQKRMFGFVTFKYADTVKVILAEGNPHYICGARVLVKPYKEKGRTADRKLPDQEQLMILPINSQLQVSRYFAEGQLVKGMDDDIMSRLGKELANLQFIEGCPHCPKTKEVTSTNSGQQDQFLMPGFDVGDTASSSDEYQLQSNAIRYVLDLLDGEKEIESMDSSSQAVSRVDLKPSESSFENLKISEGSASTVENIKSYCFGSESTLLNHNRVATTFFADRVF